MRRADPITLSREEVHDAVLEGVDAALVDVLEDGERYVREDGVWRIAARFQLALGCGATAITVGPAASAALSRVVAHWARRAREDIMVRRIEFRYRDLPATLPRAPRMSFFLTRPQILAQTKTVTRRAATAWLHLARGDVFIAIEKGQGLRRGESQRVLALLEVVDVRVEPLNAITQEDCRREGFPQMTPAEFCAFFRSPRRRERPRCERCDGPLTAWEMEGLRPSSLRCAACGTDYAATEVMLERAERADRRLDRQLRRAS